MLEVRHIRVSARNGRELLRDVSFSLGPGQVLGLTGQSGSGKTTLIKSVMGILDRTCRLKDGGIAVDGVEITGLPAGKRRNLCGTTLGFVPQNPMTAFDGRVKVGKQVTETFRLRLKLSGAAARGLAEEKLEAVNLTDAGRVLESYPGQVSGGMLQRVAMAILLGLGPRYILADEPTSALDETNRLLLLELLRKQAARAGILMISHDVSAMQSLCEKVLVMAGGEIIEEGTMDKLLFAPEGQWTKEFAAASQRCGREEWKWREL
ncbi:MAG: ATP-binding cassette domain-containing protein [Peptococcaceae bacterium]|nr:ATP-binding cassette domain-containing protein [Peptococcaceae bacterium]